MHELELRGLLRAGLARSRDARRNRAFTAAPSWLRTRPTSWTARAALANLGARCGADLLIGATRPAPAAQPVLHRVPWVAPVLRGWLRPARFRAVPRGRRVRGVRWKSTPGGLERVTRSRYGRAGSLASPTFTCDVGSRS